MGCLRWSLAICVLLITTGEASPKNHNHKDEVWQLIVSQLVPIWKNRTETTTSLKESDSNYYEENPIAEGSTERGGNILKAESNTVARWDDNSIDDRVISENIDNGLKLALGWIIAIPIISIIFLCCCCYGCYRCCCGRTQTAGVIVMQNQNTVQPQQQPQQIIIQQPVYMNQHSPPQHPPQEMQYPQPPPYDMRQGQAPVNNPMWDVPAHYHNGGGVVHNPNFAPPNATAPAPPQYFPEKF